MNEILSQKEIQSVEAGLRESNQKTAALYPGENESRQPVHTVYGGAQLYQSTTTKKIGELALRAMENFAPDAKAFSTALGLTLSEDFTHRLYERVKERLTREAVEDFRIDFEDGFGNRPDKEEDEHALRASKELAIALKQGIAPYFIGIRIKPFTEELKSRSIRTLNLFLSNLLQETGGTMPSNFVVTLPKVTTPEQVEALTQLFEHMEKSAGLPSGELKMEFMVETTQSIFRPDGSVALLGLAQAAGGRCLAAHFGTYDYTASCDITAKYQAMDHSACDFAKHHMKVALAGTGIWLSDGATNVMPVPTHRGDALTETQIQENLQSVHRAWQLSFGHIRHSLSQGFYQGWDLHPAQLPVRYAALYAFFLEGLQSATERLSNFIDKLGQATLVGDVFDDAATGQGLLNYFLRAVNCGAITEEEASVTGLTRDEIACRSFAKIVKNRRSRT